MTLCVTNLYHSKWKENCLYSEKAFFRKSSLREECFDHCLSNPKCTHFTWFENMCYLQSGRIRREDAFQKPGFTCGIVSTNKRGKIKSSNNLKIQTNLNTTLLI